MFQHNIQVFLHAAYSAALPLEVGHYLRIPMTVAMRAAPHACASLIGIYALRAWTDLEVNEYPRLAFYRSVCMHVRAFKCPCDM